MRVGLIATEFPPAVGGMQSLAWDLATTLSRNDQVTVFTTAGNNSTGDGFDLCPILSGDPSKDARRLYGQAIDVWMALNAGLIAMAPWMIAPFFAYVNGTDFLDPWIVRRRLWLKLAWRIPTLKTPAERLRRLLQRRDIAAGTRALRGLFAISSETERLFKTSFRDLETPVEIIPPGVRSVFFQPVSGRHSGPLRLLTVARLEPRKNVDGVLKALSLLPKDIGVQYTIVGEGTERGRLEQLTRSLKLEGQVTFHGRVSDSELLRCYREADLFVLAARATALDVEGFGIVYLEASASGVPVICSREGGATDAVQQGWNGIVLPTSTPTDIALGIRRFSNSRSSFSSVRVQSFARQFEWSSVGDRIRKRLLTALNSPTVISKPNAE